MTLHSQDDDEFLIFFSTLRFFSRTITNVEEHIKNAFISETALSDSSFRHIKIDDETMEIKRQLDPEILREAALFREQVIIVKTLKLFLCTLLKLSHVSIHIFQSQEVFTTASPTTVIPLDDLQPSSSKKLVTSTERTKSKLSTTSSKYTTSGRRKDTQKPIHESDIDMENLPVIQGSFEITKTDADIAQKRSGANQRPASTASLTPSTLKPFFISPASSIKIKSADERQQSTVMPTTKANGSENILEMFLQHQRQNVQQKIKESPVTAKIEKTNKKGETTVAKAQPTTTMETLKSTEIVITSTPSLPSSTEQYKAPEEEQINKDLPKLDVSLFTSAPVLDNEPWRPINPSQSQIKANFPTFTTNMDDVVSSSDSPDIFRSPFNPKPQENVMYRNKFVDPDSMMFNDTDDADSVFYQSFYNPDFSAGDLAIEKLGIADVRPYPLPVNKIDLSENQNVPSFKPISTENDDKTMNYDEDKFEHLGGGVIAKKTEANDTENANDTLKIIHDDDDNESEAEKIKNSTELTANLSDIFQELINLDEADETLNFTKTDDNKLESRIVDTESSEEVSTEKVTPTTTERLNFMNMKDFIVQMQKNKSDEEDSDSSETFPSLNGSMQTTEKPTTTFVEVETLKYTPPAVTVPQSTASPPQLFPGISKWEFVNGSQVNATESSITKKVFNETLQAVIVENSQTSPPQRVDDLKANRTVDKANLQQLSSIFDTLAAKLGIKPIDVASKMPPFSQQNKLKNNGNRTRGTLTTRKTSSKVSSTTPISKQRPTATTTTRLSVTKVSTVSPKLSTTRPTSKVESVTSSFESFSSESMMGQAEVEPVDPTKYDEILSLLSSSPVTKISTTTPSLVTLLPVKSNSGIRNFNPRIKLPSRPSVPEEMRNMETVVKASMSFDS